MLDSVMAPRVWKWGYTKNRTYWKLSTSAVRASLGENLGALSSGPGLPHENMNLGLAEMQFPAVLTSFFGLFLVDILSRSQFFLHPSPPYFHATLGELRDPYFQKVRYVLQDPHPRGSTSD